MGFLGPPPTLGSPHSCKMVITRVVKKLGQTNLCSIEDLLKWGQCSDGDGREDGGGDVETFT